MAFACLAAGVLLAPAVAMMFSNEVNWGSEDFLAAAVLLLALWTGLEVVQLVCRTHLARLIGSLVLVLVVVAIWGQLAVGIL